MKRWSTGILVVVATFVAALAVLMMRAEREPVGREEAAASVADYRIREVRLREESRNGTRWQLDAEEAEVFEEAGRTSLRSIVITVEDRGQTWTVTGEEGDLLRASKDVELRGNVVVVASDGLRLETERLRWDGSAERAWTHDPVTLYRPGAVVEGRGLEARIGEERMTIGGRVRATLTAPPRAGEGAR